MTRAEINRRYYDKTQRRTHIGPHAPLCNQRGPVVISGATCRTCLMIEKARRVGSSINEWERKRLDALFRARAAEKSRKWRAANPEKARAAQRRWREKNLDLHRIANREWCANNRDWRAVYNRARRDSARSSA